LQINLNDLKTVISILVTLRTSCSCGRGRIVERWKNVVENDGKYFD